MNLTVERPLEQQAIGQIAVDLPGATALFRRLRLDFCCGGQVSLAQACERKGLDTARVLAELASLQRDDTVPEAPGAAALEDVPVDRPLAVVIGNEFAGASPAALGLADLRFGIPMRGFAQSLNLSVFAGIALHALAARMRPLPGWDLPPGERDELVRRWSAAQA